MQQTVFLISSLLFLPLLVSESNDTHIHLHLEPPGSSIPILSTLDSSPMVSDSITDCHFKDREQFQTRVDTLNHDHDHGNDHDHDHDRYVVEVNWMISGDFYKNYK